MNREELIEAISTEADLTKAASEKVVKAFIEVVSNELANKGKVQIVGFGTFETAERAARVGQNPQTGEKIEIPASTAPKFKAGKALKDIVNA